MRSSINSRSNWAKAEKIVQEKLTGTTKQRPEFQDLLARLEVGDTLIVTKLDRFARNTKEALEIIQSLFEKGVSIHILNIGLIGSVAKFENQTRPL